MIAKYDDTTITLTPRYVAALEELGRAELEMMRQSQPGEDEDLTWCQIFIGDLSNPQAFHIFIGGENDRPAGFPRVEVMVLSEAEWDKALRETEVTIPE